MLRFDLERAMEVLQRTPDVFRALLAGLPDSWVRSDEGASTFSPVDNLAHLIHGEKTDWIPRARLILDQGPNRTFEPFDRFAHREAAAGKTLEELLTEFSQLRNGNLNVLRGWNLTEDLLDLGGEHPELGSVTLRQLLATWVVHDLGHIAQTARVMAKQYGDDVGPWREYLPVLSK